LIRALINLVLHVPLALSVRISPSVWTGQSTGRASGTLFNWLSGRRIFPIVFCVSVVLTSTLAQSAVAAEPDLRLQVRAEIKQLASPSRAARAKAEQALTKLGPDILPLLPPPDLLESASVRVAIRRVRVRLEHDAAELSLRPSKVTLAGDLSVKQLVEEIEKQTGNAISTSQLSSSQLDQRNSVMLDDATFWSAISYLESEDIFASFDKETGLLTLRPGAPQESALATKIDRSFRIMAAPFQPQGIFDDSNTLISTQIRILCEPRLRPLFLRYETSDFKLSPDGENRTLEPFNAGASIEVPLGNGGREATLALSFLSQKPLPENAALNGKLNLLVAASEQPISFRKLDRAKRVSRRRGGVTVTVNEVGFEGSRPEHHNARIRLQVSYDLGAHAFESHQTWVFHNRVYLVDPDGKLHGPNGGFTTLHQGDGSVAIEYSFKNLPTDPATWDFVYVAPTLLINVEIPISLSGIPIAKAAPVQK
jgi:hypothetical protein